MKVRTWRGSLRLQMHDEVLHSVRLPPADSRSRMKLEVRIGRCEWALGPGLASERYRAKSLAGHATEAERVLRDSTRR